jgi:hypothetical protein
MTCHIDNMPSCMCCLLLCCMDCPAGTAAAAAKPHTGWLTGQSVSSWHQQQQHQLVVLVLIVFIQVAAAHAARPELCC